MVVLQAILLAITANFATGRIWSPITWPMAYPLINGTIVGLVLGDPLLGMMAGATINLAYLGWISAGGTMPSNIGIAGVYGTAITILSGASAELAISLAVPIGLLGVLLWQLQMTLNTFWVHRLDKNAENGELNKVWLNAALFPQLTTLVVNGTPAIILVMIGGNFFTSLLNKLPEEFINSLTVAGGLLPAIGVAMLLNYLGKREIMPYFILGFFLAAYLNLAIMPIAIIGACISLVVYYSSRPKEYEEETMNEVEEEQVVEYKVKLRRRDLVQHWLIGLGAEIGYNYERMQASGNVLAMVPIIKRLYKTPEDRSAAMKRYLIFYNTEPSFVGNVIPGIVASMEEQRANGAKISDEMINGLRTGLMGPMAGVGDSLAGGIIYPITMTIALSLALEGNFLGPILFFVMFTGTMLILGYFLYNMGYKKGGNSIMSILSNGKNSLTRITDAFGILGLFVIGALGAVYVNISTPLKFSSGETEVVLQDVLNDLIPKLLPFTVIMITWYLLRKRVPATWTVLILIVLGIAGYYLGLFSSV